MSAPLKIIGLAGSLRSQSYSRIVLDSMVRLLPAGATFQELALDDFPHYNEDHDGAVSPESVETARRQVSECDAVIIVTPEFNHGIPGVLKNALDWLSRPAFDSCMVGKPVLFATVSPGSYGGVRAQYQMRETLAAMLCTLVPLSEIAVGLVHEKVTEGQLADDRTIKHMAKVLASFLAQTARLRATNP
jgi:chromate reductase